MPIALEINKISKIYPGTIALDNVSLAFEAGKVHALIGKNGAGKSTLIKIISGAVEPTSGSLSLLGQPVSFHSPQDALAKGVTTVYQELSVIPHLTVAENLLFGRLPRKKGIQGLGGITIDWQAVYATARTILNDVGIDLDVRTLASELGVAQQQLVEIARAMSRKASVLMLDEPTSALAHHETQNLFRLIRRVAAEGVAVIYISHRLQELPQIVDTVSVLRGGSLVGTISIHEATPPRIADMMFGQIAQHHRPKDLAVSTEPIMKVQGLAHGSRFKDVSFSLCKGEVLGIAGMLGSGRTSLLMSLFGAEPFDTGSIEVAGNVVTTHSLQNMKALGLGLTPENRKEQALVQSLGVRENMCMASMETIAKNGFISQKREAPVVKQKVAELQIALASSDQLVSSLSGGNQQKIVVGNWLNTRPRIMLFDEPTRGIDLEAKQQIFEIIWELSRQGISSIFVSSELEEVLEVCQRVLIMRSGEIVATRDPQSLTMGQLLALCMGE